MTAPEPIPDADQLSRGFWELPVDSQSQLEFPREGGTRSESFLWHKYAPTAADVHRRGCDRQHGKNKRLADEGKDPVRYIGARSISAGGIRAIESRGYMLMLKHQPEDGDDAHTDVAIAAPAGASAEGIPKNTRREIIALLFKALAPLDAHTCS